MKKTSTSVPSIIPIEFLTAFRNAIIKEHRVFLAISRLEEYYKEIYEVEGKEVANWFWWAAKRHLMYKTGELKRNDWQKGGEDFEGFFKISLFELNLREIARIPKKYVKSYYYFRLRILISMTIHCVERDILLPLIKIKKEYEFFPAGVRKSFYEDHGNEYKYTREEIEEMMSRRPGLIIPARAKVYQMPF